VRWAGVVLLALLALGSLGEAPGEACGDKFLVIGRGVRRIPAASHPASILLYMNPRSELPAAAQDLRLESSLKRAGHRVARVADATELRDLVARGKYDLVVVGLSDARGVAEMDARSQALVVVVAHRASASELAAARSQFDRVVQSSEKGTAFLKTIDDAAKDAEGRKRLANVSATR
jgi:hypothetical protein